MSKLASNASGPADESGNSVSTLPGTDVLLQSPHDP
jgi:hypothetical protein